LETSTQHPEGSQAFGMLWINLRVFVEQSLPHIFCERIICTQSIKQSTGCIDHSWATGSRLGLCQLSACF